jgi:hypothetical protein
VPEPFEILPGLPGTGPVPYRFGDRRLNRFREGFVVRFYRHSDGPWVGNFDGGWGATSGVFAHPDGRHCIVIAAGVCYVIDPETTALQEQFGGDIDEVIPAPDRPLLILVSPIDALGYGEHGLLWRTRRLSWDGWSDLRIAGDLLVGQAWDCINDCWMPFEVDLATGVSRGGCLNTPDRR